jgi:predicted GH43/DUF377 family glycosyl hydrolase
VHFRVWVRQNLMRRYWRFFIAFFAAVAVSVAAGEFAPPFGKITRVQTTPVLSPRGKGFESAGVFNPAVIKAGNKTIILYRAQDAKGTSRIGYATSDDGLYFERRAEPVLAPEAPYEKGGGVEDQRVVEINGRYWLTYTGYNNVDGIGPEKKDAQLCLAVSTDLVHWKRRGVIMPAYQGKWNVGWTKSGAIVTERIHGKYWMYYLGDARDLGSQMGLATSDDLVHWSDATREPVLRSRPGTFDSRVVEPGPPPALLPEGILLIYNGADDQLVYRTGWVLFDKDDPARVLARSDQPVFEPEHDWEKIGQVPNVVFVEGLIREPGRWLFYYGGADKYIGVAAASAEIRNLTR